jgi:hypothetical protein
LRERIEKLLRVAFDDGATEGEAAAAFAHARRMMLDSKDGSAVILSSPAPEVERGTLILAPLKEGHVYSVVNSLHHTADLHNIRLKLNIDFAPGHEPKRHLFAVAISWRGAAEDSAEFRNYIHWLRGELDSRMIGRGRVPAPAKAAAPRWWPFR